MVRGPPRHPVRRSSSLRCSRSPEGREGHRDLSHPEGLLRSPAPRRPITAEDRRAGLGRATEATQWSGLPGPSSQHAELRVRGQPRHTRCLRSSRRLFLVVCLLFGKARPKDDQTQSLRLARRFQVNIIGKSEHNQQPFSFFYIVSGYYVKT